MKPLLLLLVFFNSSCETAEVYVCDSRSATRYHLKEGCKGLKGCSYGILKTTEQKAKEEGKTLCKWEK